MFYEAILGLELNFKYRFIRHRNNIKNPVGNKHGCPQIGRYSYTLRVSGEDKLLRHHMMLYDGCWIPMKSSPCWLSTQKLQRHFLH